MILLNDYIRVLTSMNTRTVDIEVILYDKNFNKIDSLEGTVINGSITIDANNKIRRNCNIEMVVKESKYGVGFDKSIWLDKYIQIIVKVLDIRTGKYLDFNFGYFIPNNPSVKFDATNHIVSFTGLDLMSKMSKEFGNNLKNRLVVEVDAPIKLLIESLVEQKGGFPRNRIIVDSDKIIPYKLEKKEDDGVLDVIDEVKNLYLNYQYYFDEYGVFHYEKTPTVLGDPIWFDFTDVENDMQLSIDEKFDFENARNLIIVNGKLKEDKSQPSYTWTNNNPNSQFSIDKIGERNFVVNNDKYFTQEQCQSCAEYQAFIHGSLNQQVEISCVPIYFLDVNKKVKLYNKKLGMDKVYIIQSINIPLSIDQEMTFSAIESVYDN